MFGCLQADDSSAQTCQCGMLEALVAALPEVLLLADEHPPSDVGMHRQHSGSVDQLVSLVLGACSAAGVPGVLSVLRLPALLAPHVEALLARGQVSPRSPCMKLQAAHFDGSMLRLHSTLAVF